MCLAPQPRALFRHLNFQKWSQPLVFLSFWLRNVLRATRACTFSTSQLPKVVRGWGVLYILTWKCASRHNGVHFFISHLASCSAPAALASLLFDPPEPQIIAKTQCFATFLPFRAYACSFFWLFLFSDLLSSNLSLLSASALLCFSSVHIVGSLTSKLPSAKNTYLQTIIYIYIIIYTVSIASWDGSGYALLTLIRRNPGTQSKSFGYPKISPKNHLMGPMGLLSV